MINQEQFKNLTQIKSNNCISIYIPTHRAGHNQEDNIRFKNALSDAVNQLTEKGMTKNEAYHHLRKGYELLDNTDFWLHLSDGLVVFINENHFEYHIVPIDFNPFVYVHNSFYLRPLVPLMSGESRFFILALSQHQTRFFEGSAYSITPIKIEDLVPIEVESVEEALLLDLDSSLQHRSGQTSNGSAMYHGHGEGKDKKDAYIKEYFNLIDKGLMEMLHDEKVPMIIAAVDYLVPMYREVSNYPHIVEAHISGNPENEDPTVLHEKAWSEMRKHFDQNQTHWTKEFTAYMSENKASFSIHDIIPAAIGGRVDALFIDKDQHTWGKYDETTHTIEIHNEKIKDSDCLLDLAAKQTFLNGGTVYNIKREDMPQGTANVNAVYRY